MLLLLGDVQCAASKCWSGSLHPAAVCCRGLQGCRTQFSRKGFKANVSLPEVVSAWTATHSRAPA